MKKIKVDGYEISVENGNFTKATFIDADGNEININLEEDLRLEFDRRRKEEFKEQYEKRKHIDTFIKDDYIFEVKTSNISYSIEDKYIEEEKKDKIIKEICKLPAPQNRRVFMSVVSKYSLTKIANIEGVSVNAIKSSIMIGKKKLQKILRNF
ncbi:MAG: RNA polymerase sigma factor [Bacilli bacterium]